MMGKVATEPPFPVLERADIDEAEGRACRRQNRMETWRNVPVEAFEPRDQSREIFVQGAYVVRKRSDAIALAISDEAVLIAQPRINKARVANRDALQPFRLGSVDRAAPRLAGDFRPSPDAVLRRVSPSI